MNIAMDGRHHYWGQKISNGLGTYSLIHHIDLALTAVPECAEWYVKEGCFAMFFPEVRDPDAFHPMPELLKIHDVCFMGKHYGIRRRIVGAIEASSTKVSAGRK